MNEFDDLRVISLRLLAAVACGAILGVDRDIHGKPAGLRVLSLVSLGGAIVTLASLTLVAETRGHVGDGVLRTVQGLLSGIGFLGAGVIMRSKDEDRVHGMTTAASVWLSSIMGITCGLGQWKLAFMSFLLALLTLLVGRRLENAIIRWGSQRTKKEKQSDKALEDPPH